jgi:hypothetical protein
MERPAQMESKQLRRGRLGNIAQDEFPEIILAQAYLAGGQASRQIVINTIHDIYSPQFAPPDYERLTSQTPPKERWIHNIDWARLRLVKQGLLLPSERSPYGTWVLSETGTTIAAKIVKDVGRA